MFLGIVGHLYGSCPEGSEQSYTEREHEAADAASTPKSPANAPGAIVLRIATSQRLMKPSDC
ncbi:MAG: hypothetical protein HY314_15445 [Acidobacteria bacterium]|nr:hypothetical protein [Acidobacteriota bacterium]